MKEILIVANGHYYYTQSSKIATNEIKFPYVIKLKDHYLKLTSDDVEIYLIRDSSTNTVYGWKQSEKLFMDDNGKQVNRDFDKRMNSLHINRGAKNASYTRR